MRSWHEGEGSGTRGEHNRVGRGVPVRRGRWQLLAVWALKASASTQAGTPPGGDSCFVWYSANRIFGRLFTSRHCLQRRARPPHPGSSSREAGRDVAGCRKIPRAGSSFRWSGTATSRPVGSFAALILRWRTTSAALPSCGAAQNFVPGVRPPRLSPRSAAVRRQVLTGQFDMSTAKHNQGREQSDGSSSPADSVAAYARHPVLHAFQ